jgi:hypothetical protein
VEIKEVVFLYTGLWVLLSNPRTRVLTAASSAFGVLAVLLLVVSHMDVGWVVSPQSCLALYSFSVFICITNSVSLTLGMNCHVHTSTQSMVFLALHLLPKSTCGCQPIISSSFSNVSI